MISSCIFMLLEFLLLYSYAVARELNILFFRHKNAFSGYIHSSGSFTNLLICFISAQNYLNVNFNKSVYKSCNACTIFIHFMTLNIEKSASENLKIKIVTGYYYLN